MARERNVDEVAEHLIQSIEECAVEAGFDVTRHKRYIYVLTLMKRLSDQFELEKEQRVRKYVEAGYSKEEAEKLAESPPGYTYFVPPEARWGEIRRHFDNPGEALNRAARVLEDANPSLKNLLTWVDFENTAEISSSTLHRLLNHFSDLSFSDDNLSQGTWTLGEAFIRLIDHISELEGTAAHKRITPPDLNGLIALLAEPKEGMRIYDPAAGSASTLIACVRVVEGKDVSLWGQEADLDNWRLANINLILHGLAGNIEYGDVLRYPKFVKSGEIERFDRVVCHPEFSLRNWGAEEAREDPYRRFGYGIPPKNNGDWAFIQHILASTEENGKAVLIVPHGVLFRGGTEAKIRGKIVREDLIEAIIGLPSKIFYGVTIPGAIIVFNKAKPEERRGKILFIDASGEYEENPKRNRLREGDIQKIVETYRNFEEVEGYSRVVDLDEIEANEFNLNISRYVAAPAEEERAEPSEVVAEISTIKSEREELESKLGKALGQIL